MWILPLVTRECTREVAAFAGIELRREGVMRLDRRGRQQKANTAKDNV
jgi:hypothetical protein